MKTIKIIELLVKKANGEEMPRKIKYCGATYLYNLLCNDYEDALSGDLFFEDRFEANKILNDEVEILDEEDEFEDIDRLPINELYLTESQQTSIVDTINALIKNQKKIIERLKDGE